MKDSQDTYGKRMVDKYGGYEAIKMICERIIEESNDPYGYHCACCISAEDILHVIEYIKGVNKDAFSTNN